MKSGEQYGKLNRSWTLMSMTAGALAIALCVANATADESPAPASGSNTNAAAKAAASVPGSGKPRATQPEDVEIATVCAVKKRYCGWPTIARRASGELLVVFSGDRHSHVCPYGKVQIVRSGDDGKTWSAPETIYSSDTVDCRDAGVVELADGTLVLNFFTSIAYGRSGRKGYESLFKEKDKAKIAEELGFWTAPKPRGRASVCFSPGITGISATLPASSWGTVRF